MKDKARFAHTDFTCLTGHKIHAAHVSSMKLQKAHYKTCYTTIEQHNLLQIRIYKVCLNTSAGLDSDNVVTSVKQVVAIQ